MPYVETRRACASRICYQAHSHPTFSIGAVDQGQSRFFSHQTGPKMITASSLVLMPANVVHCCNPMPEQSWSYQMMHLDVNWLSTLLLEDQVKNPDQIVHDIIQLPAQVVQDINLYQQFTQVNNHLFDHEVTIAEKEQLLIDLLIQLFAPNTDLDRVAAAKVQQIQLRDVLDWLAKSEDFISLQVLAEHLQISRFTLIRLFKQQFGLAPHAYQINLRINQARALLRSGRTLADVAFSLGFCDQSHFHRSFKAHAGVTPKQYQQVV